MQSHDHGTGRYKTTAWGSKDDCQRCQKEKARMDSPEYKAAQERFRAMQENAAATDVKHDNASVESIYHNAEANPDVVAAIDAKFPPRPVTWTDGSEIEVDEDRLIREPYAIPGKPPTWGEVGIIALMVVGMFVGAIAAGGL